MVKKALYLAGGGARGAYQAGVLKAIVHILKPKTCPFQMISGVSVGSLNAAFLADYADNFSTGVERMEELWGEIRSDQIYASSNLDLVKSVFRNASSLVVKQKGTGHLLDTTPLQQSIQEHIDFSHIATNIAEGHVDVLEILTNCYESQQTISFYDQHAQELEDWSYARHASKQTTIQDKHILASSSLPLFFPPVTIDNLHYGDGGIGLITPLRGAIRCKMDKILIIGTGNIHIPSAQPEVTEQGDIGFAYVLGNMMNGLFMDTLDHDIEMVNRMNDIAVLLSMWKKRYAKWRPIKTHYLRPSLEIASIAKESYSAIPAVLRGLLNVLGPKKNAGDLVSFLLFEKKFTRQLINLGYKDTMIKSKEIEEFFA